MGTSAEPAGPGSHPLREVFPSGAARRGRRPTQAQLDQASVYRLEVQMHDLAGVQAVAGQLRAAPNRRQDRPPPSSPATFSATRTVSRRAAANPSRRRKRCANLLTRFGGGGIARKERPGGNEIPGRPFSAYNLSNSQCYIQWLRTLRTGETKGPPKDQKVDR
jgi:hypothetical protein